MALISSIKSIVLHMFLLVVNIVFVKQQFTESIKIVIIRHFEKLFCLKWRYYYNNKQFLGNLIKVLENNENCC